jgi:hypothetical protein
MNGANLYQDFMNYSLHSISRSDRKDYATQRCDHCSSAVAAGKKKAQ